MLGVSIHSSFNKTGEILLFHIFPFFFPYFFLNNQHHKGIFSHAQLINTFSSEVNRFPSKQFFTCNTIKKFQRFNVQILYIFVSFS